MSVGDNSNNNNNSPNFNSSNPKHTNSSNHNSGRSRYNQQNDRQNNNSRRNSNYNGNRNHTNRNRHLNDSNIPNNSGNFGNSGNTGNPGNSSSNRDGSNKNNNFNSRNSGNRYEQGHNFGHNNKNYESKNNQPQLTQSLLNSMDEFPSLDGSAVQPITTPQIDSSYINASTQTSPSLQGGDLSNNFDPISSSTNSTQSNLFSQHQQPNTSNHQSRQYNNRRGSNNYNKNNGPRDHQQNSGRNNYNRQLNGSYNQNQNNQGNQHNLNPRPRNNRRGGNSNSNYENNRRQNNRDYNVLPNMMNGMRIGMNPAVAGMNPIQFPYMAAPHGYPPPIIAPIPAGVPQPIPPNQMVNPLIMKDQGIRIPIVDNSGMQHLPPPTQQDLVEAEQYKNLTSNPSLSRSEHIKYQIEYYFSNNNLRSDAFLRGQMDPEGWVNASIIIKFNRVAKFNLTFDEVLPILSTSTKLEYKQDEDNNVMIRRKDEPEKWVQKDTDLAISQNQMNQLNGLPPLHSVPFSVPIRNYPPHPPYIGGYIHPSQIPMNYGLYPIDDINSPLGLVYDPNMAPGTIDFNAYQEAIQNSYVNPYDFETQASLLTGDISLQDDVQIQNEENVTSIINDTESFPSLIDSNTNILDKEKSNFYESYTEDFKLTSEQYKELLKNFIEERNLDNLSEINISSITNKIYRYWTHNLVIKFDKENYDKFRIYAMEDATKQQRFGINMLFQFYERFLHRYPFISSNINDTNDYHELMEISKKIFDDFQQDAYDDYINNECVISLVKLLKFIDQFSNSLRQTPPLNTHVYNLVNSLNLTCLTEILNEDENSKNNGLINEDYLNSSNKNPSQDTNLTHQ